MINYRRQFLVRYGMPLLFLLMLGLPFILSRFHLRLMTEAIIYSLYAVSYNLLLGYAGLLSFGHAMFFGVGAFFTAITIKHTAGMPFLGVVALATLFTTLVGLTVGVLLLRVKGTPFALLTLAFNALFFAVGTKWHSLTGGDDGLSLAPPPIDLGFMMVNTTQGVNIYYITLLLVGLAIAFCWYFTKTAMGQSVLLMRENEERMRFLGYNTNVTRLILFTFTGAMAGLAGSFYALFNAFVSLDAVSLDMTTKVLLMTFIGGAGNFAGPVLGSFFYTYVQDFLSDLTDNWPLIMGLLFIGMVLFAPGGLSGLIRDMADKFTRRTNKEE